MHHILVIEVHYRQNTSRECHKMLCEFQVEVNIELARGMEFETLISHEVRDGPWVNF